MPDWDAIKKRSAENRAKRIEEQLERQRARESHTAGRGTRYLAAARQFKRKYGRWPSPSELRDSGLL